MHREISRYNDLLTNPNKDRLISLERRFQTNRSGELRQELIVGIMLRQYELIKSLSIRMQKRMSKKEKRDAIVRARGVLTEARRVIESIPIGYRISDLEFERILKRISPNPYGLYITEALHREIPKRVSLEDLRVNAQIIRDLLEQRKTYISGVYDKRKEVIIYNHRSMYSEEILIHEFVHHLQNIHGKPLSETEAGYLEIVISHLITSRENRINYSMRDIMNIVNSKGTSAPEEYIKQLFRGKIEAINDIINSKNDDSELVRTIYKRLREGF